MYKQTNKSATKRTQIDFHGRYCRNRPVVIISWLNRFVGIFLCFSWKRTVISGIRTREFSFTKSSPCISIYLECLLQTLLFLLVIFTTYSIFYYYIYFLGYKYASTVEFWWGALPIRKVSLCKGSPRSFTNNQMS